MGTETVSESVMDNGYDSVDDKPLVFKRKTSVASNSYQSKSNPQRSKAVPSSKVSPMRSPVTNPNGTTPSNRTCTVKSSMPSCSSKASPAKSPLRNDTPSTDKDRSLSRKDQSECKSEQEDSEDNRPISSIRSGNSKGPTSSRQVYSPQPEKKNSGDQPLVRANRIIKNESDDETPISMFQKKIVSGMSGAKKLHQNGSTLKNEVPNSKVLGKRPLEKDSSPNQSSLMKAKVSASPTSVKMKQDSVKKESDDKGRVLVSPKPMKAKQLSTREDGTDDDDDDAPISMRFKSDASSSKTSAAKPKAIKLNSTSASPTSVKMKQDSVKKESDDKGRVLVSPKPMKAKQLSTREDGTDDDDDAPISKRFKSDASNSKTSAAKPKAIKLNSTSASPTSVKMKQDSVKKESDDKGRVLVSPKPMKAKQLSTREDGTDDDDDVPISKRFKSDSSNSKTSAAKPKAVKLNSTSSAAKPKVTRVVSPRSRAMTKNSQKVTKDSKYSTSSKSLPSSGDGQRKWTTLVHNGVIFPPPYKPHGIKILYEGKPVDLTIEQEEVATMFAVMRETDYYNKPQFRENFWNDWRKLLGKKHVIQKLDECDFTPIYEWHLEEKEKKKQMSTEEKKAVKEEKLKLEEKYMWAVVDGVKEKVGNFRVEPPGLFRGRGEHPKMGKLKRRIRPCEITLNIGKDAPIPECPITGESWKEVKHDNTVTWLAFWNDPINPREFKYVFLAASSSLKGLSDKEKYEKARNLTDHIDNIRTTYTKNFTAKDVKTRQIAVATYLIDKLALRAGNEKDDDEADTVGCCTLKVGNVECIPPNKIKFDFLGKDSIQYVNTVEVEPLVYKAIGQFQAGKSKTDDLFDELDTSKLNAHLKELVPGLTAKVFRTYNASITLDAMLNQETKDGDVIQKIVVYQKANKEVAIICNHQRTVSKSHGAQIEKLAARIEELREGLKELKTNLDRAKKGKPPLEGSDGKKSRNLEPNAWEKKIAQQNVKIEKMERDMHTKEDLKTVALGTSKINYLDPRITVAWCKRHEVPIEKIFTKSLLEKFAWAMDVEPDFRFSRQMV